MIFRGLTLLICILYCEAFVAQNTITCPSPYVYMDGGNWIKYYDPGQPPSSTNPANTNIPTMGGGLALMPNINGGTLCPTFYTTSQGNYHYWNGSSWVNTGHGTGNSAAVNIGGCGSYIYNLVGSTGEVYVYNGTTTGSLLTTITGFSSGGPYDITTDCDCNFYVLKTSTTTTGQSLTQYNPSGVATASYALVNMPSSTAGGGFAIIGNKVYLRNSSFYVGTISGSSVTFTNLNTFSHSPGDFASCPTCTTPPATLTATMSGAQLDCVNPTASLVVSTTASPVSYKWYGPGVFGSSTSSVANINAPGTYTCEVTYLGCPAAQVTLTTNVVSNTVAVSAVISPSGNICIQPNQLTMLSVSHGSPSDVISWSGPGISGSPGGTVIAVNSQGSFSVMVTDPASGCTATDVVNLVESPVLSLALDSPTMCVLPTNGSRASIIFSVSGASSHTFYPDVYYHVIAPAATIFTATPAFNGNTTASGTLIGQNSFCFDTLITNIAIHVNPTVSITNASICPGEAHTFTAIGASTYTWAGNSLSSHFGTSVTASPSATSVYSVTGNSQGCFSQVKSATITLKPVPTVSLTPSSPVICLGSTVGINAQGTAATFTWEPVANLSASVGPGVTAAPPASRIFTVTGELDGCLSQETVTVQVQTPPTLSISLSSTKICFNNFNGSLNSITLTPNGANSYTLLSGTGFMVKNAFSSPMQIVPSGPPIQGITVATTTLIGHAGVCTVSKTQTFNIIANPVLSITPPSASVCPGGAQVFEAGGATSYTWLPAPGLYTYTPNSIIGKPKNTSFFAVYGSSLGCMSDFRNAVLVVLPIPQVTVSPVSSTICEGSSVALVAGGDAITYSWSPSQTLSSSAGTSVIATTMVTREYTVTGTFNTCTNQAVATISAIAIPTIEAHALNPVICSAASTDLKASGAMSFSWIPRQTLNYDNGTIVRASPHVNTTYTVWGFNGICSGSTTVLVRTVARPDLKVFTEGGQNAICSGEAIGLMASGAQHYEWFPPQYVQAVGSNTSVIATPPVTTNFTVAGSTFDGTVSCPQVVSFSVIVVPKTKAAVAGNNTICLGQRTTLEAFGGNTYKWVPESGLNSYNSARVVASPTASTVYTVEVAENTYCGSTTTVMVKVDPRPHIFAGRDTSYHVNDVIMLKATGTGSINWVSGEGIACPPCPLTQVYPSRNTCYIAEATNEFGCTVNDEICLTVTRDFNLYVPNSFTPNNDGLNDVFIVYGENIYEFSIDIYDRWGQLLFHSNNVTEGWDGSFRGNACKPDVYVYKLSYKGLDRKTYKQSGHISIVR